MCAREVLFGHFVWHSWLLYFTLETAMPLDVVKTERMEVLSAIPFHLQPQRLRKHRMRTPEGLVMSVLWPHFMFSDAHSLFTGMSTHSTPVNQCEYWWMEFLDR